MMERGLQRWIVDISKWDPSSLDFSLALSVLPQHEHSSITRFVKLEDRKRALVSRLLQYALVCKVLGIPHNEIIIKRTMEGKPYLECGQVSMEFPNFNFNVSHHGDYVAIASEPLCLVGVDTVCCIKPKIQTVTEFIQNFISCFSTLEWHSILSAGANDEILDAFYRYWSLKEAYVKAIGCGVTYGLDRVEFHHTNWTNIWAKVNGKPMPDCKFWLFELPKKHYVSLARVHPRLAIESYKSTMYVGEFDENEYCTVLSLPNIEFSLRTVEQLMPAPPGGGSC